MWPISAAMAVVAALWLVSLPALARWRLRRQYRAWFAQRRTLLSGPRDIAPRVDGLFAQGEQGSRDSPGPSSPASSRRRRTCS
jgi:hypothetical protein